MKKPQIKPSVADLQFMPADGIPDRMFCAACGRRLAIGARSAELRYEGGNFRIYLCGERCVQEFKTHPTAADTYIAAQLEGIKLRLS